MKYCLALSAMCLTGIAWSSPSAPATDRLIVRMSPKMQVAAADRIAQVRQAQQAGARVGVSLSHWRRMGLGAEVLKLPRPVPLAEARRIAEAIGRQDGVEWAVASQRRFPAAASTVPDDPEFDAFYTLEELTAAQGATAAQQIIDDFGLIPHLWYLRAVQPTGDLKTLAMSINWLPAWQRSDGFSDRSYQATVAVVDTGILPHGDLEPARILPGYDFIHDSPTARDGGGRDDNPRDQGDWSSDLECERSDSSWHGTFVAGIVGATANNGVALAGINPQARILPVRTLGKCGGYDEDIIDGALWAGGLSLQNAGLGNAPTNPNVASVVNLSLGGEGACNAAYQDMVGRLRDAGVVVIAAAGNSRRPVADFSPANCPGVLAVASTSRAGALADYSNYGSGVTISAPGGGTTFMVTSTSNTGLKTPAADTVARERGTSFSSPMVAAAVSLVQSVRPGLAPDEVTKVLQLSASPFPAAIDCDVRVCGAGVLNVDNAVQLAITGLSSTKALLQYTTSGGIPVAAKSVTITNNGMATVGLGLPELKSLSGAEADYSLSHDCPSELNPAASCVLSMGFSPALAGGRYAWVELPAGGAVLRVALFGINTGAVFAAEPAGGLQFSATLGQSSASQQVRFRNASSQPLSFAAGALTLPTGFSAVTLSCDGGEVVTLSDCRLPPEAELTLDLVFTPPSPTTVNGVLNLKAIEGTTFAYAVQGTGIAGDGGISGGGGGCSVASGQRDVSLLLLLPALLLLRRRR